MIKYIKLNNGLVIPQIGLGTYRIPLPKLPETLLRAYDIGYTTLFDTAWRYENERTISDSFNSWKGKIKRQDIVITTKLNIDSLYFWGYGYGWNHLRNIRNGKSIKKAIQESFDNLRTDYIDIFLIHHPYHNYLKMWEVLSELYEERKIKAIGVSSFLPSHIESLKEVSGILPAINQIEISPLNTQKPLIKYCQDKGIAVQAMSTFSHFRSNVPRYEIIESDVIRPIAEKYGKSIVQVVLRWLIQQDIIVIPKTWVSRYMKENISIFDFELTNEEMKIIDSLDLGHPLNYDSSATVKYVPKQYREYDYTTGVFKSYYLHKHGGVKRYNSIVFTTLRMSA